MHRRLATLAAAFCALLALNTVAEGQDPLDDAGWTTLTPPAGAQVFYVATSGSDSNPGSQAAPFRSIQRGYSALRDGWPDQLLLRCGDTWNESGQLTILKGCNTPGQYQVIGSYGAGPRPRLNYPLTGIRGEPVDKRGVAIVGLEVSGTNTFDTSGICMLSWHDVLIEDCLIRNFRDNIVIQDAASNGSFRINGLKIRRNVIIDAKYAGAPTNGRAQGAYIAGCDNWLIEGNVFDLCGIEGSLFSHNVYIHETSGAGTFKDNITARSPSEGIQQRPGGNLVNNLSLANSYGYYMGPTAGMASEVKHNVVLDSKDINSVDRRGIGIQIDGSANVNANVVAHNQGGTGIGVVKGFSLRYFMGTVTSNVCYDWSNPLNAESHCYFFEGGGTNPVTFTGNGGYQPNASIVLELWGDRSTSGFTASNNKYWAALNYLLPFRPQTWTSWRSSVGEAGSTFAPCSMVDARISAYMQSLGQSGGLAEFVAEARQQSKQYWRPQFTAMTVNDWVRGKFGIPAVGGGGGGGSGGPCYANCDASTGTPVLTANDFACFISKYAQGNSYANCDNSTGTPVLTPGDFVCFINKYSVGCP